MDGVDTLSLNLYETGTVEKLVNLTILRGVQRVPSESDELHFSNEDASSPTNR